MIIRKAQGFTENQIAQELKVKRRTVSAYTERVRDQLGFATTQEMMFAVYQEYAKTLWVDPEPVTDLSDGLIDLTVQRSDSEKPVSE